MSLTYESQSNWFEIFTEVLQKPRIRASCLWVAEEEVIEDRAAGGRGYDWKQEVKMEKKKRTRGRERVRRKSDKTLQAVEKQNTLSSQNNLWLFTL